MDRRGQDANKEMGAWPLQREDGDRDWCAAVEIMWSGQTEDEFGEESKRNEGPMMAPRFGAEPLS